MRSFLELYWEGCMRAGNETLEKVKNPVLAIAIPILCPPYACVKLAMKIKEIVDEEQEEQNQFFEKWITTRGLNPTDKVESKES